MAHFKTRHFSFYHDRVTQRTAMAMAAALEDNYDRIVADMKGLALPVISVYIHPDKSTFKKMVGFCAQGAIIGIDEIHVVKLSFLMRFLISPDRLIIHEFAHCATLNLLINNDIKTGKVKDPGEWAEKYDNPKGLRFDAIYPRWLWESVACYEAGQLNIAGLYFSVVNGLPSLQAINKHNSKVYFMGYTLAEFIISGWGKEGLTNLILEKGDIMRVLGIEWIDFDKKYHSFLKQKYFGWYYRFLRLSSGVKSNNLL